MDGEVFAFDGAAELVVLQQSNSISKLISLRVLKVTCVKKVRWRHSRCTDKARVPNPAKRYSADHTCHSSIYAYLRYDVVLQVLQSTPPREAFKDSLPPIDSKRAVERRLKAVAVSPQHGVNGNYT